MVLILESFTSGIYLFSDAISCSCLTRDAEAYINKNFLKVVQEEEFMDLPKESLVHFLHSENLRVENEFQVFKGMALSVQIYKADIRMFKLYCNFVLL